MKKETLLTFAVLALLILNFGTLGFIFFNRGDAGHVKKRGNPQADELIMNALHLDVTQEAHFDELKHEHHMQMVALDGEYRNLLQHYFELLQSENQSANTKDSLEKAMGAIQAKKASVTYAHFNDIKAMCSLQQQQAFDTLVPQLIRILLLPPKNLPPPRREE